MTNKHDSYRGLCERIKTLIDAQGFPSIDSSTPLHLVHDIVLNSRTTVLKEYANAKREIGKENFQTIPCVTLEDVDENICPCSPPKGCTWKRTKLNIPRAIQLKSVTNTTADFKATYVEWSKLKSKVKSRSYNKKDRYFTIMDTGEGPYLYLFNDDFIENISVTGLWESPYEAIIFSSCGKETKYQKEIRCNPLDTPLYMDGNTIDTVFSITYNLLLGADKNSSIDIYNDSLDTTARFRNERT